MKLRSELQELRSYVHMSPVLVTFAIVFSTLYKVFDVLPELFIGIAIDVIVNPNKSFIEQLGIVDSWHQFCFVGGLIAIFWIMESIFEYLAIVSWRQLALDMQHQLRLQAYNRLQHADVSYITSQSTGDMLHVVYDDINQLEKFVSKGPNEFVQLIVNSILLGGIFFYVSPRLATVTLLPMPVVLLIAYFFQNKLSKLYRHSRAMSSELAAHMVHRLQGMMTIRSYVTQNHELRLLEKQSTLYCRAQGETYNFNALYMPIMRMVIMIGFISTLTYGGMLVMAGKIPLNWYAVLVFLMQKFLWPFTKLALIADMYEDASACLQRILQLLARKPTLINCSKQIETDHLQGVVQFDRVTFGYRDGAPVLKNLSFTIPAKHSAAFVGTTGSGKSTIVSLLLRFYDPSSGIITVDGKNLKLYNLANLRQLIGLVSQDIYIVDGTILDNIVYGSFDATREEVEAVARLAQADEFISKLPQGYDTVVQEHGKNLSGGQRQRIAIARALLKKSPILIFDEATSAVDNETQAALEQLMFNLKKNHTIITIAHRLSTVKNADIIYVLDKGNVVEFGTHDELLAKDGLYARLYSLQ